MSTSQVVYQFDSLLDERQVARLIGMSVASLRRWRLLHRGPKFLRVGGSAVRYRPEDLASWLAAQPTGGSTAAIDGASGTSARSARGSR